MALRNAQRREETRVVGRKKLGRGTKPHERPTTAVRRYFGVHRIVPSPPTQPLVGAVQHVVAGELCERRHSREMMPEVGNRREFPIVGLRNLSSSAGVWKWRNPAVRFFRLKGRNRPIAVNRRHELPSNSEPKSPSILFPILRRSSDPSAPHHPTVSAIQRREIGGKYAEIPTLSDAARP